MYSLPMEVIIESNYMRCGLIWIKLIRQYHKLNRLTTFFFVYIPCELSEAKLSCDFIFVGSGWGRFINDMSCSDWRWWQQIICTQLYATVKSSWNVLIFRAIHFDDTVHCTHLKTIHRFCGLWLYFWFRVEIKKTRVALGVFCRHTHTQIDCFDRSNWKNLVWICFIRSYSSSLHASKYYSAQHNTTFGKSDVCIFVLYFSLGYILQIF